MKRNYFLFTVIFFVMLLLPGLWDFAHSVRSGEQFVPLDVFRDMRFPFEREASLRRNADSLKTGLEKVFALAEAENASLSEAVADLDDVASRMKRLVVDVNAYLPEDSSSFAVQQISEWQKHLADFETDGDLRDTLENLAKNLVDTYGSFSWKRIWDAWWNHGFLSGKYLRAYEDRLDKENAFVKKTRPFYQAFAWNVLRDPGEKAVLADSGFLFYRQDVEFLVRPAPWECDSLDNPIDAILDFQSELQKRGVELLVVVVPGKPSIYPEFLNPSLYGISGKDVSTLGESLVDSLAARGVLTVNLYPVLQNAKLNDRDGDFLYLNTDTHWSPRGAAVAASAVASAVKKLPFAKEFPKAEWTDSLVTVERTGDVATMADLEGKFPTQTVEAYQVKSAKSGTLFRSDFRKAQILILGDSYSRIYETDAPMSAGWISQFAKEMQTPVAHIVSDGGASTLVREKLSRRSGVLKGKKLLVWEFVERDLRFGAEGWKKVRLD